MPTVLINYKEIVEPNRLDLLKKIVGTPVGSSNFEPVLLLSVTEQSKNALKNKPKGEERILYLNSSDFLESIKTHEFLFYNPKKKLCLISKDTNLETTRPSEETFSNETCFWVAIPTNLGMKVFRRFVEEGFRSPYVSTKSPIAKIERSVCLMKFPETFGATSDLTDTDILNKIKDLKSNKTGHCPIRIRLSKEALEYLKRTPRCHGTKDAENELTGELKISKVSPDGIYTINISSDSIKEGSAENVNVSPTRYNFHSHPKKAYIRHSVELGWPSVTDYLGYHQLGENTVCHFVATLEGLYVLSFGEYWCRHLKNIPRKFISKNFDISHKKKISAQEYVKHINSILLQGKPIYKVYFFPWEKADTVFKIHYPPIEDACFVSEDILKNYRKIQE